MYAKNLMTETLTDTELQILTFVALGYSNQEIAKQMFYSRVVIKKKLMVINRKLVAKNRAHAVAIVITSKLISLEGIL